MKRQRSTSSTVFILSQRLKCFMIKVSESSRRPDLVILNKTLNINLTTVIVRHGHKVLRKKKPFSSHNHFCKTHRGSYLSNILELLLRRLICDTWLCLLDYLSFVFYCLCAVMLVSDCVFIFRFSLCPNVHVSSAVCLLF